MLGAGTIINPILKIVTTVAILAAVGIFIIKPVLQTTEDISNDVNESVRNSLDTGLGAAADAELNSARSRAKGYLSSLASSWPAAAVELRTCIKDAGNDVQEMNFCANFGSRVVTNVSSNRSRALSYADSLSAQGDTAGAAQVEQCVKDAGFETAAMRRCFNLADDLLFG